MSDAFLDSDAAAPLNTDAPLPLEVDSLQWIPETKKQYYTREMSGTFRLTYIHESDSKSFSAHMDAICSGKLRVLLQGESPALLAAAAQAAEALQADVLKKADALTSKTVAERQAVFDKRAADLSRLNERRRVAGLDPLI